MSFGSSNAHPNQKPKPLGVSENKLSGSEQAKPIPYLAGKNRIAVTFISEVFDIKKTAVTRDVGKQKTRTGTSYFFSFAALVCHGPVDGIHEIWLNGEKVWPVKDSDPVEGMLRGVLNPDYVDITLEDYGLIRLYWGTETQERDAYLYNFGGALNGTGPEHPPYRGQCYLVAHQLFAGFNQSNVQNFEVVVSRYPELGASPATIGTDANPINVLYEWMTHPRIGRGISEDFFDAEDLEAVGVQIAAEKIGISPIVTSQVEALALLNTLLEYIDGYPIITEGLFSVGLVRPLLNLTSVPVVDESVMSEPLRTSPEDWATTFNVTNVKFTEPERNYEADSKPWRDRGNFAVGGQLSAQTIERPWITSAEVAQFMATALGRTSALPKVTGSQRLRRTALFDSLTPGTIFKIDYPPRGYTGASRLLCRVLDRTVPDPARPAYQIDFKIDRTYLLNGLAVADPPAAGSETPLIVASAENVRIVELPAELSPDGTETLAVLAARPEELSVGFKTLLGNSYSPESGTIYAPETYQVLDTHDRWAWYGTLLEDYAGTETMDQTTGLKVQLTGVDLELDDVEMFNALADELLIFVGGEIMSISGHGLIGAGAYQIFVIRARFGTPPETHLAAAEVFIVRRSELQQLQHPSFQPKNTAILKLQPFTGQGSTDLVNETEHDVAIAGRIYQEPPLLNLRVNGELATAEYATGGTVLIEWDVPEQIETPQNNVIFFDGANPEGVVTASVGQFVKSTTTGEMWVKRTGEKTNTGWI
jgi:Putative phage tail protein